MPDPLFSILIAQYNNGQYFKDCYDSIMAQTYANWEVIIVDDASSDDSVAVMQNIIGQDPRFRIFTNEKNQGCGYTKRRAAELAQGELCAFLDPDDAITNDAVELMVAEHLKHTDAAVIYSRPYFCDENLKVQNETTSYQIENMNPNFFDLEGKMFAFLSYKNRMYKKTEGIDAYLIRAVDRDLTLKLYEVAPCYYLDKPLYLYRIHGNGISTNSNEDKAYFWYWVTVIHAAKRRGVNIENLFLTTALTGRKQIALEKEIKSYNRSFIFRVLRKLGAFKI